MVSWLTGDRIPGELEDKLLERGAVNGTVAAVTNPKSLGGPMSTFVSGHRAGSNPTALSRLESGAL